MTPLRQRMLDDMRLNSLSASTQLQYSLAVARLAKFYRRSPDQLSEEELRQYFLDLIVERKQARSTIKIAMCAIKFFYEKTLRREWQILELARPPREKKLPVVLEREEVRDILSCVKNLDYRACLITIYTLGLRLREGAHLPVSAIDSRRMMVRVRGKGNKDRDVPLPEATLSVLRRHWQTHRSETWLFPRPLRKPSKSERPFAHGTLQRAMGLAVQASSVKKRATIHTLRHSFATGLLEDGVSISVLQAYLGHSRLDTTYTYTHLTRRLCADAIDPINRLADGLERLVNPL